MQPGPPAEPSGKEPSWLTFDDLSMGAMSFLEAHPHVAAVTLSDRPGVSQGQLLAWEAQNRPHTLPEDYKSFLAISNGVTVRWSLRLHGEVRPFGTIHVNQLDQAKRLPPASLEKFDGVARLKEVAGVASSQLGPCLNGQANVAAFDLDAECAEGRVALVYITETRGEAREDLEAQGQAPQVWFQDPSCRWHFLAASFTDYFRLGATHLGVPQWQFAFTDVGLAPTARHWLALFCPERLALAMEHRAALSARTLPGGGSRPSTFDDASSASATARTRPRRRERSSSAARRLAPGAAPSAH